ncbi:putative PLAC8 motif-containing protein [Lupinus albus]|uniref:Putative PLAC8 motif-containing protein n=1 Tax=Lupinus albus TaxID=3870 RepID=A0A6A4Q138_LUPAL|nr:putative PLAC8 motif-containing protein [Lupinus albus]
MYNNGPPSGAWTTGLCGCFEDLGSCCMTCCFPCITFGQNAEVVEKGRSSCASAGMIFCVLSSCGFGWLYSYTYRSKLRGIYSLPEEPCIDLCVHCCCSCCAISQEYRELKTRGIDPSIGWSGNEEKMNRANETVPPNVAPAMTR